jgi:hypothetical protein
MISKKIFFVLSLLLFQTSVSAQYQDTIKWTASTKLEWADFQGKPDTSKKGYEAASSLKITYSYKTLDSNFSFRVDYFFQKKKSWTKSSNSFLLLKHEQAHFNIGELFARKLRKYISSYHYNPKTIKQDLKNLFSLLNEEWNIYDAQYDRETDFSKNEAQQSYWDNKIKMELDILNKYAIHP